MFLKSASYLLTLLLFNCLSIHNSIAAEFLPPTGSDPLSLKNDPVSYYYEHFDSETIHYKHEKPLSDYAGLSLVLAFDNTCDYKHPVPGVVTSKFGKRGRRMHLGIDVNLETGDHVMAAFEGKVRFADYNKSYGNLVIIRHPNGLETYYAHLSQIDVKPGDYMEAGQILGLGGNTGRSFGAHLHFETRFLGVPIDPSLLIDFEAQCLRFDKVELQINNKGLFVKDGAKYHWVQLGEDLIDIAKLYGTSLSDLCRLNEMENDVILALGAKIRYQ
jgi:hypothetical protein